MVKLVGAIVRSLVVGDELVVVIRKVVVLKEFVDRVGRKNLVTAGT